MAAKKTSATKPAKSPARKTADRKAGAAAREAQAGEQVVTIDRRRPGARGAQAEAVVAAPAPKLERRAKVQRRRQIDPTTCERDYSIEEVEFMNSMDDYKRKSGRMFPTCSEVLEVIRGLGYVKLSPAGKAMLQANDQQNEAEDAALEEELMAEVAY